MIDALPPNLDSGTTINIQEYEKSFSRPHLGDIIRQRLLQHFIQKNIHKNNKEDIATSVSIQDLQNNKYIVKHNDTTEHFAASVNKLPVTMLVLEELRDGNITLDTVLTWDEDDRRAGGGTYDQPGAPLQATVGDVVFDLLNRSGNTAVRALVNKVLDGPVAVNDRLTEIPELEHTYLIPLSGDLFYLGYTNSKEALWVLKKVLKNQDEYGQFVKNALVTNIYEDYGVKSNPRSDFIVLANKLGQLNDPEGNNRHDVGIIYNTKNGKMYGYSFLTTSPNASETATPRALESLEDMGWGTLRYAGNLAPWAENNTLQTLNTNSNITEERIVY